MVSKHQRCEIAEQSALDQLAAICEKHNPALNNRRCALAFIEPPSSLGGLHGTRRQDFGRSEQDRQTTILLMAMMGGRGKPPSLTRPVLGGLSKGFRNKTITRISIGLALWAAVGGRVRPEIGATTPILPGAPIQSPAPEYSCPACLQLDEALSCLTCRHVRLPRNVLARMIVCKKAVPGDAESAIV